MVDAVDVANSEFYYSNVKTVTTDFNVSPYYDDYDSNNNYYRILFKPGFAVQSRELTQIQSMLQEQINRFGQHVFKEGSMVLGGKFNLDNRANYVKVKDFDILNNAVDIYSFRDQVITGQTTGVKAYVNLVVDGVDGTDKTKTLYVTYLSGNPNTDEVVFTADEPLLSNVGTLVVGNTVPVGYGSVFTINEGVRFAKEHFIYHTKQSIVVDRYDIYPTCKVGFMLEESLINSSEDSSLLDPALEASNYAAPGADRFRIIATLTRLEIDDPAGPPDYVNLFEIRNSVVTELNERPIYNVLRDEIAKRTYDESGNYYVNGLNVVVEEHLKLRNNGGYLTEEQGGDYTLLSVQVEPGTAYVKGYEINKLVTSYLTTSKATDYSSISSQILSTKLGNYVLVNEFKGSVNLNTATVVDLYDTAQKRVSNSIVASTAPSGNKIGTAMVKSISYNDGTLGTPAGSLRLHIFNIKMLGSNAFSSVKSVYCDNSINADLTGDIVLTSSNTAAISEPYIPLLYYVGTNHTKSLRAADGTIDASFNFKRTSDVSIASDGSLSLSSIAANEIFPYGTTTLSSADKRDIVLNLNESFNIALPGSALSATGTTLNGNSTYFNRLNVGDKIEFSGNTGSTYRIVSISNNTTLITNKNLPTISSNTIFKAYQSGDIIDLTGIGSDAGATRTVSATPSGLSFNLQETLGGTKSGTVTYTMDRTAAKEIAKTLKVKRYVQIRVDTHPNGTSGPYDLGFSDVLGVTSVRKDTVPFTTTTQGTDVTTEYLLNNGQTDDYYGHGAIKPITSASAGDYLLVEVNYFQPDYTLGVGYFSVDSYPINDDNPSASEILTTQIPVFASPTTGTAYDLRNYIDFRPVLVNTATDTTNPVLATLNPSTTTTFQYENQGLRLPAESEQMIFDYSYYLARIDIVALNERGQFSIIKGVPSAFPITPVCPDNLMSCARIYIPPYPSLSTSLGRLIGRNDLSVKVNRTSQVRFTMKDIGVLKQRVDNLENYVALSLLEKSALDMKILDENGLDRFKNGIFVDSFTSFSLSDIGNSDHHICYDPKEGSIRPIFATEAVGYKLFSSTNAVQRNNLIMLPYTEVLAAEQPYATTIRNVETSVYKWLGVLYLDPSTDFWVNTNRLASQTYSFGATDADITPYSIVYGSWETTVTGVTTSNPVLLSSTTSSSQTSTPGAGQTTTYTGKTAIEQQIASLTQQYGASTPITINSQFTNEVTVGTTTLGNFYNALGPYGVEGGPVGGDVLTVTQGGSITYTTTRTNTYSTITSTSTQQSREYTETFQSLKTDAKSIGDKVVAVAPIADIRPQTIAFEARGVKANTRYYVFFDGQLMSSYVTPATMTAIPSDLGANTRATLLSKTDVEGARLYSNKDGRAYGFLRLPSDGSKTFRTGTKEVLLTDSPTNEPDAMSTAKTYFVAQGITQTVQETIISLSTVVTESKSGIEKSPIVVSNTTNTYTVTTTSSNTTTTAPTLVFQDNTSCMAYSFKLNTPGGEEGVFLTSVDLFCATKDPNVGLWFEIRAMDNAGTITKVQVPGSTVFLDPSQINVSDDGSAATNVKFSAPIFLKNDQEYAFIIHIAGFSPNYSMYVCVLGQTDILSKKPVNLRPLTGTLYNTNNNTDWDIVPKVDLKIRFNRAKFSTSAGEVILGNEQREYVLLPDVQTAGKNASWFGERVLGNDELTLSTPTDTINVGDFLIGANSQSNVAVASIVGSQYFMSNTGFKLLENLTVRRANGLFTPITTSITSKLTASGKIERSIVKNDKATFNGNSVILVVSKTSSDDRFIANDTIRGVLSSNTIATTSLTKFRYSTVQFEPSYLSFQKTVCNFNMLTTSNTGVIGSYETIIPSNITDFMEEKAIFSRTTEVNSFAGAPSNRVKVNLQTTSDYLSPIINLEKTYSIYIDNLINSNTSGELSNSGGGLKNKYISQIVTLAEGQDAEDLRIVLTGYKPSSSNSKIKVYARISHLEDYESIRNRNWFEMTAYDDNSYSSLVNRKDWREFQFRIPDSMMTSQNDQGTGIVQYTNGANTVFTGFKQFQIKIGLQSDNSAIFPRVADLRAIALQL